MKSKPWGIVRQYAAHRDMLLNDGFWVREGSLTERPDLVRLYKTRKEAEEFIRLQKLPRAMNDGSDILRHVYASMVRL